MSLVTWIILGLVAGALASWIANSGGGPRLSDILLGVVGAVIGGWLFTSLGQTGVTGLNLYSLMIAVIGSVLLIAVVRSVRRVTSAS